MKSEQAALLNDGTGNQLMPLVIRELLKEHKTLIIIDDPSQEQPAPQLYAFEINDAVHEASRAVIPRPDNPNSAAARRARKRRFP